MLKKAKHWILSVLLLALSPLLVFAANEVKITEDATLNLSDDGLNYTLKNDSQFDTMEVTGSQISPTLSQGGRVTLESTGRKNLTNTLNRNVSCGSDKSSVFLALDAPFTQTGVTVTPTGTCTSGGGGGGGGGGSSGSGGGGGGGGGGSPLVLANPTPTPVPTPAPAVSQDLQTTVSQGGGQQNSQTISAVLTKDVNVGQRGNAVKQLQELLSRDKDVYPGGTVSGYYGNQTKAAVIKFQLKYSIIKNSKDVGAGRVGPKTRAKLNEVFSGNPSSSVPPSAPVVSTPSPATTAAVSTSDTVKALQEQIRLLEEQLKTLTTH